LEENEDAKASRESVQRSRGCDVAMWAENVAVVSTMVGLKSRCRGPFEYGFTRCWMQSNEEEQEVKVAIDYNSGTLGCECTYIHCPVNRII